MADFNEKVLLALVAFLLGLLADIIKRVFGRERRRISYSVNATSIIAVSGDMPPEVRSKLGTVTRENITRFQVLAENTGSGFVKDAEVVILPSDGSEILQASINTDPPHVVKHGLLLPRPDGGLQCAAVELEEKQQIAFDIFIKAPDVPELNVLWSGGGGGVVWDIESGSQAFSLERSVVAIMRNYILAEFSPALLFGIGYLIPALFPTDRPGGINLQLQMGGVGVGQMVGSLIRFYFYLRMIPHAVGIVRYFVEKSSTRVSVRTIA